MRTPPYRKVGKAYGTHTAASGRRFMLMEYDCSDRPKGSAFAGRPCCHFSCRLDCLRVTGYTEVATRLQGNAMARDYRNNWGKMVLDVQHGRDPKRRKLMAHLMRKMRNDHATAYADIVVGGCWTGALMTTA